MRQNQYSLQDWEDRKFQYGSVSFAYEGFACDCLLNRKYVRVPWNVSEEEVFKFITEIWKLPQPMVIISLISGRDTDIEWHSKRIVVAFRRAIKNASMTTDMWLVTHGLHYGASKIIGNVYKEEMELRTARSARHRSKREPNLPLVLIGISPISIIRKSSTFSGGHVEYRVESSVDAAVVSDRGNMFARDLDPNHTHYILIDDSDMHAPHDLSLRSRIEYKLTDYKRHHENVTPAGQADQVSMSNETTDEELMTIAAPEKDKIPIVCLLLGGGQMTVKALNERYLIEVPILICKGSGFLADTIAYASDSIRSGDHLSANKSLKSELINRVLQYGFSPPVDRDVNTIISIAKMHAESNNQRISIIDAREWETNVRLLHRELLQVLLKYHRRDDHHSDHGHLSKIKLNEMCRRLQLLLDWNEPALAKSEIFERDDMPKYNLPTSIFEQAFVRRDREQFVDLFLDRNFQIQKYFTQRRIRRLVVLSAPDFFDEVCMAGILGRKDASSRQIRPTDDIRELINNIIGKLTAFEDTFQPVEYFSKIDDITSIRILASEKQAFTSLTLLSVLLNRHELAKILLKRSSYPIPLAMFCSLLYKRLRHYCTVWHRRNELKDQAKEMADVATGILDLCYENVESTPSGKHLLEQVNPEFGHVTSLQLAFKAGLMDFMAHPYCQRYITSEYYGGLQFRKIKFGILKLPEWLKAILCAYLVIPSRWWISFNDNEVLLDDISMSSSKPSGTVSGDRMSRVSSRSKIEIDQDSQLPYYVVDIPDTEGPTNVFALRYSIDRMFHSPMVKFHLQYFNYILFLILLAFCVVMPACGNYILDTIAWYWCLTITTELVLTTYKNYLQSVHFPIGWSVVDCSIQVLFLVFFLLLRLGPWTVGDEDDLHFGRGRIVLCLGVIYFTYRIPFV